MTVVCGVNSEGLCSEWARAAGFENWDPISQRTPGLIVSPIRRAPWNPTRTRIQIMSQYT